MGETKGSYSSPTPLLAAKENEEYLWSTICQVLEARFHDEYICFLDASWQTYNKEINSFDLQMRNMKFKKLFWLVPKFSQTVSTSTRFLIWIYLVPWPTFVILTLSHASNPDQEKGKKRENGNVTEVCPPDDLWSCAGRLPCYSSDRL